MNAMTKLYLLTSSIYMILEWILFILSQNTYNDFTCLSDTESAAAKASDEDWDNLRN
eukprot:UN13065